jgi:hypothetical protein
MTGEAELVQRLDTSCRPVWQVWFSGHLRKIAQVGASYALLARYCKGEHFEEDEKGGACSMHREKINA